MFAVFAVFAKFVIVPNHCQIPSLGSLLPGTQSKEPLSLRTGPGTGCRVPSGRGVVAG